MGSLTTLPSYCLQDLYFPQLSDHVAVLLEQQQRLYHCAKLVTPSLGRVIK
jgi:hypothetical protein